MSVLTPSVMLSIAMSKNNIASQFTDQTVTCRIKLLTMTWFPIRDALEGNLIQIRH